MYKDDKEFIEKAARIFERSGNRYSKPIVSTSGDLISIGGVFYRKDLIRIAEAILELEGFVMVRAITRRSLLKKITKHIAGG